MPICKWSCYSVWIRPYPFDSFPFLLRDADSLGARRHRRVLVTSLAEELKKLVGVLTDQFGELRVAGPDLLQDGFEHLRRVGHHLAQLLELRVVAEEVEVPESAGWGFSACCCCCSCRRSCTCAQSSEAGSCAGSP